MYYYLLFCLTSGNATTCLPPQQTFSRAYCEALGEAQTRVALASTRETDKPKSSYICIQLPKP